MIWNKHHPLSQCFLNIIWKPDIYNWFKKTLYSSKEKKKPQTKSYLYCNNGKRNDIGCTDLWFLQAQYIYVLNYIFCRLEMTSGQNISCFEESNENVKYIENYFQNYFVHMWIAHLEIKAAFFFFFILFPKWWQELMTEEREKEPWNHSITF